MESITYPTKRGLLGYYYSDLYFHDLEVIHISQNGGKIDLFQKEVSSLLPPEKQKIQSARWVGFLYPTITGDYQLSTSHNHHVIMKVDGRMILNENELSETLHLVEGKQYEICIEFQQKEVKSPDILLDFQIYWSREDQPLTTIPQENLLQPQTSDKNRTQRQKNIPNHSLFSQKYTTNFEFQRRASDDVDTDDDAIPDNWEVSGFTIQANKAVKWDDKLASRGYKKYRSNPYRAHTVGDPYSDFEKAADQMDSNVKKEARNPLVAAVPEVRVDMESFNVIKIDNNSSEIGRTQTENASYSATNSITAGVTAEASLSLFDFGVRVSTNFSATTSSTAAYENSNSDSWSEQLSFNTNDRARLSANVRYHNTGSAPIYKVQPTSSFVLQSGSPNGYTIRTVKAKENQVGEVLNPGFTYPEGGAAISLDKIDDFSSSDITFDQKTLEQLEKIGKLDLQTPQAEGYYKILNASGGTNLYPGFASIQNDVKGRSSHIMLNIENITIDRRVATKQYSDREDLTPEITLGEAIKIAFDAEDNHGTLKIKIHTGEETKVIELNPHNIGGKIILDRKTSAEFASQLEKMNEKNIFNVKLKMLEDVMQKTGMKILIQERNPAEGLTDEIYSIQTKMNTKFSMRNSKKSIIMDYAWDLKDRKFEVKWHDDIKAYSLRLVGSNQVLSVDNKNHIITKPFDNTDETQYWNIQNVGKNTYTIESILYPLNCMDVEKAEAAVLQGANVILYQRKDSTNQHWVFNKPIAVPPEFIASPEEVRNEFKFKSTEPAKVTPPYYEINGVYFNYPIDERILLNIDKYEARIQHRDGNVTTKDVALSVKNGDYYLPLGYIGSQQYSYALVATLIDKREVTLFGNGGLRELDEKVKSIQVENPEIQFNFYNSTCHIYFNDDYHAE